MRPLECLGGGGVSGSPCSYVLRHVNVDNMAAIAQLAARRSHNPKVVSSILTRRTLHKCVCVCVCVCSGL